LKSLKFTRVLNDFLCDVCRARMIFELGVKRLHRRCKEWAIKALKTQREVSFVFAISYLLNFYNNLIFKSFTHVDDVIYDMMCCVVLCCVDVCLQGYIREASERKAATDKILLDRAVAQRKEAQLQLISTAMSSDRHWLKYNINISKINILFITFFYLLVDIFVCTYLFDSLDRKR
jgi:hypothetical protein